MPISHYDPALRRGRLANEFGRDAVLAALRDVQRIRLEAFARLFGEARGKPSPSAMSLRWTLDNAAHIDTERGVDAWRQLN